MIWRLRPANFPEQMPDESLFILPEIEVVSTGENLVYAFSRPELTEFREKYEALMKRTW